MDTYNDPISGEVVTVQFAITPFICNSYLEVMKQSSQCVTLYIYGWL